MNFQADGQNLNTIVHFLPSQINIMIFQKLSLKMSLIGFPQNDLGWLINGDLRLSEIRLGPFVPIRSLWQPHNKKLLLLCANIASD